MADRNLSGILSVIGGKFGALALGLLITPILVRVVGSEGYGDYAFVLSIFAIVITFARVGISAGIRKYIAEDRPEPGWQDHVFAFYARLGLGLAAVVGVALVGFALVGPIERLVAERFWLYFVLLAAMVVTDQLFYISRYTLMGLHKERLSEPLAVLKKLLFGVFGLSLAYVGFDVAGLLAGTAIASLVCALVATWLLREYIDLGAVFRPVPSGFSRMDLVSFNAYNTVFILLTISLYNVDLLLLRPLAGSHQTGLYKAALVIAEFLWLVPNAVQIVFIHSTSELWSKGEVDEITRMVGRATRFTLVFTLLLAIGLAALAPEFMRYYFGVDFVDAVTPLLLLLPGVLGFAVARPIFAVGQGKGELRTLIVATGMAAVLNLVLNLLLIPRYGMNGAAVATSIGYGSMLLSHGVIARRMGYDPFVDLRTGRIAVTAAATAPVVFGLDYVLPHPILALVLVPPVGLFVYGTVALRTGAVDTGEAVRLAEYLPDPVDAWIVRAVRLP